MNEMIQSEAMSSDWVEAGTTPRGCARKDDMALVHATKAGDVNAFEELVKRYDVKLLRIAYPITHNREDAEEAVQDAFLKAFTKLDQFEEKSSFSTWLTRIAVNEALLKLRKYRTTADRWISLTEQEDDRVPIDVADWSPNPEQLYSATELRATLLKSLKSLTPALRVVFVLRDMAELSGEETAEVLRLGLSAVKARLFRARLQLREELSRHFRKPGSPAPMRKRERGERVFAEDEAADADMERTTLEQQIEAAYLSRISAGDPRWGALYTMLTQP